MKTGRLITLIFCTVAASLAADVTTQIKVSGMTCSACATGLGKTLERHKGVKHVQISFIKQQATVVFDDKQTTEQQIREVINQSGFKTAPATAKR